jgi:hypothetical protein
LHVESALPQIEGALAGNFATSNLVEEADFAATFHSFAISDD